MSTALPFNAFDDGWKPYHLDKDEPYYPMHSVAEPLALYRKGGYHPVHLGDIFQEGRYFIVHKLGWALDGTIWLARDRKYGLQNVTLQ